MKRVYRMKDLDCASCAAKMENAIAKISGVSRVAVNFLTQKLTIDADDEQFDRIIDDAQKICKKIEPDCIIVR